MTASCTTTGRALWPGAGGSLRTGGPGRGIVSAGLRRGSVTGLIPPMACTAMPVGVRGTGGCPTLGRSARSGLEGDCRTAEPRGSFWERPAHQPTLSGIQTREPRIARPPGPGDGKVQPGPREPGPRPVDPFIWMTVDQLERRSTGGDDGRWTGVTVDEPGGRSRGPQGARGAAWLDDRGAAGRAAPAMP